MKKTAQKEYVQLALKDLIIEESDIRDLDASSKSLQELMDDIERNGQLQPIIVAPSNEDGKHAIIAGARRVAAIKMSTKVKKVEALVQPTDETELKKLAMRLSENTKRKDLNVMQLASMYHTAFELAKESNMKRGEVAEMLGISSARLSKFLTLATKAPECVADLAIAHNCNDIESLYSLTRAWHIDDKKVEKFIGRWLANELDSNLRQLSREFLSDLEAEAFESDDADMAKPEQTKVNYSVVQSFESEVSRNGDFCIRLKTGSRAASFAVPKDLIKPLIKELRKADKY